MSHPFDFYERDQRLFFRIFGSLPYLSLYPFSYDLCPYFDASWPSLTFLSFCLLLFLFYSFTSLSLIWFVFFFSSYLMFDLGLTSTFYSCLFDVFIPLLSLFVWGSLGPRLMRYFYALHFMHEGKFLRRKDVKEKCRRGARKGVAT